MKIEYRNSIEVKYCVDVFVAGGGPAGVAAAYVASKNGAKVFWLKKEKCLVERQQKQEFRHL